MAAAFDYRGARDAVLDSRLPGSLKLLAVALIEHMPICEPSVATLAQRCSVERKTVMRALASLEKRGVLVIERAPGRRSRYVLQPPERWNAPPSPVPTEGTGTWKGPVRHGGTGDAPVPVPRKHGTGTNEGTGPVPTKTQTSPPARGHEAAEADPESGSEAARARFAGGACRTVTMPGPDPTQSYLDSALMAGVKPEQARSTWSHYFGAGLPLGGVERLEHWLVQRAKERQNALATVAPKPAAGSASSPRATRPGDDLDTTGAATAFRSTSDHRDFASQHLKGHDLEQLVAVYRRSAETERKACSDHQRDFLMRLKHLALMGKFIPTGPLPKLKVAPADKWRGP